MGIGMGLGFAIVVGVDLRGDLGVCLGTDNEAGARRMLFISYATLCLLGFGACVCGCDAES